jgi:predicted Fe-Mo cluster-binding NifX family protein
MIAVPTRGKKGLRDEVSDVFARAPTFTFIELIDGEVGDVKVEENKEAELIQGSGPIVAKNLIDKGVNVVLASELGPGVTTVLEMNEIRIINVDSGLRTQQALEKALEELTG